MFHIGKHIGLIVLLSALGNLPVLAKELPHWGIQPVNLGSETIVFSGTGSSLEAAQVNALATLMTHLSSNVQTRQSLTLSKENTDSNHNFSEHTTVESLTLDLTRIKVLQQYEEAGTHVIQLSITRDDLEQALLDKVTAQSQLALPEGTQKEQVIWALQNIGPVEQALRYERVLASLRQREGRQRQALYQQRELAKQALQNAGIRIVLGHELQHLTATLSRHFPSSSEELFWLKVEQKTFRAKSSNGYHHRQVFNFSLIDAQLPFTPFLNQEVIIDGLGITPKLAAQDSQQKSLIYLQQDLSFWFFKQGNRHE